MIKQLSRFFWELIKVFLIAALIIVPIRYFVVQPFFVRGSSMEPNFHNGEYLVIDELSYYFRQPARGEVVVLRFPNDHSQFFIKRIIGLPGDSITVADGLIVVRNSELQQGAQLDETSYLAVTERTGGSVTLTLHENEYFVLGDNRAASSDSRSWGALERNEIVGRAWLRAWPLNRLNWFELDQIGFLSTP
jgi:signal peptidase I